MAILKSVTKAKVICFPPFLNFKRCQIQITGTCFSTGCRNTYKFYRLCGRETYYGVSVAEIDKVPVRCNDPGAPPAAENLRKWEVL